MDLDKACKDIRSMKIQGAINVAKKGAQALFDHSEEMKFIEVNKKINLLRKAAEKLIDTRPTEPALRNALAYYFSNINKTSNKTLHNHLHLKYNDIMNHFKEAESRIVKFGAKKIKDGMIVYTHCHSSTVCNILIRAKEEGRNFEVYNTETRPLYQGRMTAKELAKAGIKVTHFVDSAARHAIKKADIVLLGADAITTTKVYNKIGSEIFSMVAHELDVPVFCCADSWKFDPDSIEGFDEEIEKRMGEEVWPNAPKNVEIYNYAFDKISPEYITGIISDLGVYNHSIFVEEAHKTIGATLKGSGLL